MFGRGRGKIRGIPLTLSLIEFEFLEEVLVNLREKVPSEELLSITRKMQTLREKVTAKAELLEKFPIREG
jgi:hypothetical protein